MKIAVMTWVFPAVSLFLPDFFSSLAEQNDQNFDLLIGNDGLDTFKCDFSFRTKVCNFSGTPAAVRKQSINWALELGYDGLIFADADDTFHPNRMALLRRALEIDVPVVFHDLHLWREGRISEESMFAGRFRDGQEVCEDDLRCCNFLGLSNTAVRTYRLLEAIQGIPDEIVAFDWTFFVRLLSMRKIRAKFVGETSTYYRQHGNNLASPCDLTDGQILLSIAVKKKHYSALVDLGAWYEGMASRFLKLEEMLAQSISFRDSYLEKARLAVPANPLWWEIARLPEEIGIEAY